MVKILKHIIGWILLAFIFLVGPIIGVGSDDKLLEFLSIFVLTIYVLFGLFVLIWWCFED